MTLKIPIEQALTPKASATLNLTRIQRGIVLGLLAEYRINWWFINANGKIVDTNNTLNDSVDELIQELSD